MQVDIHAQGEWTKSSCDIIEKRKPRGWHAGVGCGGHDRRPHLASLPVLSEEEAQEGELLVRGCSSSSRKPLYLAAANKDEDVHLA